MATEFAQIIGPLAQSFFGEPNRAMSSEHELRYGKHGSLSVDLAKGTWYDHEIEQGGGALDLVTRETKLVGAERLEWMKSHGFLYETVQPNGGAPRASIIASYDYTDEGGGLLFQVCRFEPKDFRQRRKPRLGVRVREQFWQRLVEVDVHAENGGDRGRHRALSRDGSDSGCCLVVVLILGPIPSRLRHTVSAHRRQSVVVVSSSRRNESSGVRFELNIDRDHFGKVTTDKGKSECAFTHGGTSAAAPNAAGVFALALSVRYDSRSKTHAMTT